MLLLNFILTLLSAYERKFSVETYITNYILVYIYNGIVVITVINTVI